jgi:hypothetical protein
LSDTGDLFRFDDANDKATQTTDVFWPVSGANTASIFIEVPIQDVHKDKTRDPRFGLCQSGKMRKRLLLTINLRRSYRLCIPHPIQLSRTAHFNADAEKLSNATH